MRKLLLTLALVCSAAVHAQNAQFIPRMTFPAVGYPQNCNDSFGFGQKNSCLNSTVTVPALGGSYVDSNTGGIVTVVTAQSRNAVTQYSTPSAFSAHNTYIKVLNGTNGGVTNNAGESIIRLSDYTAVGTFPSSCQSWWSAVNDDTFFYLTADFTYVDNQGQSHCGSTHLRKLSVSAQTTSLVADFSAGTAHPFYAIDDGGTAGNSKDDWKAFYALTDANTTTNICLVNLNNGNQYCYDLTSTPSSLDKIGGPYCVDFPAISKGIDSVTGKRYVWVGEGCDTAHAAGIILSFNPTTSTIAFENRPEESTQISSGGTHNNDGICDPAEMSGQGCVGSPHGDVFEDAQGRQYFAFPEGVTGTYAYQMTLSAHWFGQPINFTTKGTGGGRYDIQTIYRGSDPSTYWQGSHTGCAFTRPLCVVSTYDGSSNTSVVYPNRNEMLVLNMPGPTAGAVEARMVAKTKNQHGTGDYWQESLGSMSPDGTLIAWATTFIDPGPVIPSGNHVVVVAQTGFAPLPVVNLKVYDRSAPTVLVRNRNISLPPGIASSTAFFGYSQAEVNDPTKQISCTLPCSVVLNMGLSPYWKQQFFDVSGNLITDGIVTQF